MLRTAIIENPSDLKSIRSVWEEVAGLTGATMFQGYVWNETALTMFRDRESPRILMVESDAGTAILPCVIGQSCKTVHFAGDALFDYRNALLRGDTQLLSQALQVVADWGMDFEFKALRGEDSQQQWSLLRTIFFANAPATRTMPVEEFLRLHSRLGRHSRRIRKQGVEMRRHRGENRALVKLIYDLKAEQDVPGNLFRDSIRREFMVEIAARPESNCEIFTYETPATLVAALLTFRDGATRRCYTTYFDAKWASYSPGQVLLFDVVAESMREGIECDYMTGEYPYKNRLATEMVPLYQVHASAAELKEAVTKTASERIPLAA